MSSDDELVPSGDESVEELEQIEGDEAAVASDLTVVVPRLGADETVVVPRISTDKTVVVPRKRPEPDETVVVVRASKGGDADVVDAATPLSATLTEVAQTEAVRVDAAQLETQPWSPAESHSPGPQPVKPRTLDSPPETRPLPVIAPGSPWQSPQSQPSAQRGLARGLPVSYPARSEGLARPRHGIDEVARRIGPPPEAGMVQVRPGREALPSMVKRSSRSRIVTLSLYAAVILVSISGLWGIAKLAFGW